METVAKKTRRDITVVHPAYGRVTVTAARDKLDAITEAARRWGAQWSKLVAECSFEEARSGEQCRVAECAARDSEEAQSARAEGGGWV